MIETAVGDRIHKARLYLIATVAGIALYVVLDAAAQSLPPHYSPISQAETDLAVGPYGYIMALNSVNRGVSTYLLRVPPSRLTASEEAALRKP